MASAWATVKHYLWLLAICSSLAGVQFVYSIQFAIGGPLFNQQFKVAEDNVAYILATAGPVSGFVVQPIVGAFSDQSTSRFGRRRPFVVAGILGTIVGMLLIAFSDRIGVAVGDVPDGPDVSQHVVGLSLAISGLWLMNVCVNVVQGPARAIVADIVAADQQQAGNAMVSCVMGFAAIAANAIGAQFLHVDEPYFYLFLMGVGMVFLSGVPTVIFAREPRHPRALDAPSSRARQTAAVFRSIWRAFRTMPRNLLVMMLVFFFSWCAFSPFMIYISIFYAKNVFQGDEQHAPERYRTGVQYSMYALAIFAGCQLLYSFALPLVVRRLGVRTSYFAAQLLATGCYVAYATPTPEFMPKVVESTILAAIISFNFTSFNSIPFALIPAYAGANDAGLYMGVLNSAAVVAQMLANLAAGQATKYMPAYCFDDEHTMCIAQNVAWGIATGAVWSLFALVGIWFVQPPPEAAAAAAAAGNDDERAGETAPLLAAAGDDDDAAAQAAAAKKRAVAPS